MPLTGKPNPQPLPENNYPDGTDIRKAYDQCLALEQRETWFVFVDNRDLQKDISEEIMISLSPSVAARVLGYALLLAPSEEGRNALMREVIGCNQNLELLAGLAHLYIYGLIRVFYNPKGPTPAVSATQSPRLSFEQAKENMKHLLQKPAITAKELRQVTLFRDENRCVFTGVLDIVVGRSRPRVPGTKIAVTRVAHIISQSLSENIGGVTRAAGTKFEWAKTAGAIIERFGGFSSHDMLGDDVLNSPLNAFTASTEPHEAFDQLDLWLTPVKNEHGLVIPNTYDVEYYWGKDVLPDVGLGINSRIMFRSAQLDDKTIPAPDPRLIALHAACARIAHMSGAAEHLEEIFRDTDQIPVMTDPSAASELTRVLKNLQFVSAMA